MATIKGLLITTINPIIISLALPFCNFKGFYRDLPLVLHKLSVALLVATFPLILDH